MSKYLAERYTLHHSPSITKKVSISYIPLFNCEQFPANHKFAKAVNVTVGGVEGGDGRGYLNRTGLRERVEPLKGNSLTFISYSVKNIR